MGSFLAIMRVTGTWVGSYCVTKASCRSADILWRNTSLATTKDQGHHSSMPERSSSVSPHIIAFAATCNPDRAKKFYRDMLGLRLVSEEVPFALVFDAHGTMLRVTIVKTLRPAGYNGAGLASAEHYCSRESREGFTESWSPIRTLPYQGMKQDELGIRTSPGGGRVAWFKDPDGNTLSISEHRGIAA